MRIPPSQWYLQGGGNDSYFINVDYSQFPQEDIINFAVRDMLSICNSAQKPGFQVSLLEFLEQFRNIERRWKGEFENFTTELLTGAAQLQEDILSGMPVIPVDFAGDATVIALALNCLALTQDISIVSGDCVDGMMDNTSHVILQEAHHGDNSEVHPLVEVRKEGTMRKPRARVKTGLGLDDTVGLMLQHVAQLTHQTLIRQDPRDWPTVLYVLCILCIVVYNVRDDIDWMLSLSGATKSLKLLISDLCRLYYICTQGGQPLTHHWDREAYETRVGDNQIAIRYCSKLNEMWLDGGKFADETVRHTLTADVY